MKKHMLITVTSLILVSDLNASEGARREHFFRPSFQKKLQRVKSVRMGSFKSLALKQKHKKKAIFIDWQKLYWGKLSDLIYPAEEAYEDDVQEIAETEEQNSSFLDTGDNQVLAKELRQELKSFARQYGLKIVWRKTSPDLSDGTAAFLEYWDKGLSQAKPGDIISFADLFLLSDRGTDAKGANVRGARAQSVSLKNAPPEDVSFNAASLKKKGDKR